MGVQNTANINTVPFLRGLISSLFEDSAIVTQEPSTAGKMETGDATANLAALQAIDDGEFNISINGVSANITGMDLTGASDLGDIAAIIEVALVAEFPGATVTESTGVFTFTSGIEGTSSSVSFLQAVSGGAGTSVAGLLEGLSTDGGTVTAGTSRSTPILAGTVMTKIPTNSLWTPYIDPDATDGTQYPRGILLNEISPESLSAGNVGDIAILLCGDVDSSQLVFENSVVPTDVIASIKVQVGDFLRQVGLFGAATVNTEEFQPLN